MIDFANAQVLVVGGAGFVGCNLVRALLKADAKSVTVVDNLLSAEQDNLPASDRVHFIEGSICDDAVLSALEDRFEFVFHLATYHGNQSSMEAPLEDHENNTLTTLKLCERIKSFSKLKSVVYSSAGCTVAEKTDTEPRPTTEDDPVSLYLDSPYQISKIIGELYFNYYFGRFGLPVIKARFQNVYGPGEVLGAGQWRHTPATVWRNVTPTFIYKALKGFPLPIENGGVATRDFIYVDDIVRGLMLCATKGRPGEVYNIASGVETSILELANMINELAHNPVAANPTPARDWDHSVRRLGCTEKSRRELGFVAKTTLREGLAATIGWTLDNMDRIEHCIARHSQHMTK